ncbi:MarR family transcriptional regulator [Pigmentiphaga soli]|uniref:MarR family transcriptional regulator n=1 Tax=Pigmentiphaga soli TaxID=1007095 RepID=A0ABP8HQK7_9BURK
MPTQQQGLETIHRLGRAYRAMQAAFSSRVGHALPRWRILLSLWESGPRSQKQLAERSQLDPASLTRQLHALQELGWIERRVDPQDNRLTNVSLTAAGRGVVDAAMPRRAAFFEEAMKGLTAAQIEALNEALGLLERNFRLGLPLGASRVPPEGGTGGPAKPDPRCPG